MERLLRANEVAEYVGENVRTVYRKAEDGTYPCYRSGRLIRFKMSEIDLAMKEEANAKKRNTRCRSNLAREL